MGDRVLRLATATHWRRLWCCAPASALLLASSVALAEAVGPPPTVVAIEVRTDVPISEKDVRRRLALEVGEALEEERVVATLRQLEAAGWGSDIEITTRPAEGRPDAVVAVVVLRGSTRVVQIAFDGASRSSRPALRRALAFAVGDFLDPAEVAVSVDALQKLYAARGHAMAHVGFEILTRRAREVEVRFIIRPGDRTTVSEVRFEPVFWENAKDPKRLESVARKALDFDAGSGYSLGRSREAAERLESRLHRAGYRLARVDAARVEGDPASGSVVVIYPVTLGPLVTIELEGAGRRELGKNALDLGDAEGYDEALVQQLQTRLERRLQEHGHHDGTVTKQETRAADEIRLVLTVDPGPKSTLVDVRFDGNEAVSDEQLQVLISASPKRFLQPASGRLIDESVKEDLANVRSYYALQGYGEAAVGPARVERGDGSEGAAGADGAAEPSADRLTLVVPVVEGPRTEVASLSVVGTEALADEVGKEAIQRRIGLVEGGPFHAVLLQNAVDGLAALYDERGFEGTEINSRVTWPEERRAAVDILAREGTPIVLDRVSVRGRAHTAPGVIERLIGLKPGDRVTTLKLLAAQRRLYGLGIFSRADLELLKTGELSDQQDLIVSVTEAPARRLSYALGYDSDEGPRGLLGWYHSNLFGRALSWQNDIRLSRDEEQLRTFFSQPFPGRFPIIVSYAGFRLEQQRPSYFSKQLGSQVQADYYAATRRWSLLYGYRNVDLELDESRPTGVGADPIPREDQQVQISSVTPSLFIDRRDDPIDARRGWSSLLALESAFPLASAEEEFLKLFAQFTWARALKGSTVFAASLRLGGIEPYPDAAPPDFSLPPSLEAREIPISERFFGGGRTTHRAYDLDFLGIPGQTLCGVADEVRSDSDLCVSDPASGDFLPVGGDGLALVNLDLRFPILGSLGGVAFVDGGNVWSAVGDIDAQEFKWGAGLGLRYLSPIGPLRAEIAWKLDRLPGESAYEFTISFGNPF